MCADHAEQMLGETRKVLEESNSFRTAESTCTI